MDVPGCDDGSLVVVVGWASFLVLRVFLVEVPACDDGSLVVFGLVFRVFSGHCDFTLSDYSQYRFVRESFAVERVVPQIHHF